MASVYAAGARELREDPQPVIVDRPKGGAVEVTPPNNAFVDPVVKTVPIPMDKVRKDLMPPELVALLERGEREGKPGLPTLPPGMQPPLPPGSGSAPSVGMAPSTPPAVPQATGPMPRTSGIQTVSSNAALEQHRTQLRDGLLPSEREMAADALSMFEARKYPVAVATLLSGATSDPAITVRVACIRNLGKMQAGTPEVLSALQTLCQDSDARIAGAAQEVLGLIRPR